MSDNAFIPRNIDSNAYKAYLAWKAAQDVAAPIEPQPKQES